MKLGISWHGDLEFLGSELDQGQDHYKNQQNQIMVDDWSWE